MAWPDAALDERERLRRLDDVRTYLSLGSTRAERVGIAHRYRIRWLLLTRWHPVPEEAVVVAWSRMDGGGAGAGRDPLNRPEAVGDYSMTRSTSMLPRVALE